MNSKPASPRNVVWLILWAILGFLVWAGFAHARSRKNDPDSASWNLAKKLGDFELKKKEELSLKEQELRAKSREAASRRQAELENILGGPVQAAFKNPDYSLRQALHRAALAVAPTNADVRVDVDRFTEFTIDFSSHTNLSTNEMITVARQLLPVANIYLNSVRFSVKGSVIAELDRQDIEYADDWAKISNDRIALLLAREIPMNPAQDAGAIERLKQEQQFSEVLAADRSLLPKLRDAERQFSAAVKAAYDELAAAIALAEKATSLADVHKPADLDLRKKDLIQAAASAKKSQMFFANPQKSWRDALAAQTMPNDAVDNLQNSFTVLYSHDAAKSNKAFEALQGRFESSKYFLEIAAEQFGNWEFNAEFGQFAFSTEELDRRFNRARNQLIADTQALESALRAWNEATAP